ncbi:hypothetical protein QZH41_011879 [Actinostola sp. cb2023]|nr:hypothetical protein QZH41_011879 [Actinostola sp. cb2023]
MESPTIERDLDEIDRPKSQQKPNNTQNTAEALKEPFILAFIFVFVCISLQNKPEHPTLRRVRIQKKNSRYYFQHPYFRLFIAYFVIFCNFFIYAEDPVSHSVSPCTLPVLGNVYSFVVNKYPSSGWAVLKIFLWLVGLITGMLVGKFIIHKLLLRKLMRLSMFRDDNGSWMIMFLTTIILLFFFSIIFNAFLGVGGSAVAPYVITDHLYFVNKTFMKAAGMGTWMGDFVTAWMVTDMILQDKLYPYWNKKLRKWWQTGWNRIVMFWTVLVIATVIVATAILTDYVNWDYLNRDFVRTNELSRAFLASFILICDLVIVMQDWDFPLFRGSLDVKLPGVDVVSITFSLPRFMKKENWAVHITGKWFNYGIIMMVIILDLNMWKNQIFYSPYTFGQYTDSTGHIYTILDKAFLATANETMVSYNWRQSHMIPSTNQSYGSLDQRMNSKYLGYSLGIKSIAFIPSITAFITFGALIWFYGREEFVVEAIVVDGAPVKGIIVESELVTDEEKARKELGLDVTDFTLHSHAKSDIPENGNPSNVILMKVTYV